jgi:hypothetical protein
MSDINTPTLAPVSEATAAAFASLSPESAATAHAALTRAGYDTSKLAQGQVKPPVVPVPADVGAAQKPDSASVNREDL